MRRPSSKEFEYLISDIILKYNCTHVQARVIRDNLSYGFSWGMYNDYIIFAAPKKFEKNFIAFHKIAKNYAGEKCSEIRQLTNDNNEERLGFLVEGKEPLVNEKTSQG